MIRRDALRVSRAAFRIQADFYIYGDSLHAAFRLQEIAASYCLMRDRLLGLYENSHVGLLPQLEAALSS